MNPNVVNLLVAIAGFIISVGTSLLVVSYKLGKNDQRITDLEANKANLSDVTAMKETLAEIKGMFVLRLRE